MRARNIKPGFFTNEILGSGDPLKQLLFEGLWCLADRAGRLEDRPLRIRAEVFPYRPNVEVNRLIDELAADGFCERYEVGNVAYIQVVNFDEHQRPHHTERDSNIPGRGEQPKVKTTATPTVAQRKAHGA